MAKEFFGQYLIRRGKVKQEDIDEGLMLQEILHESVGAVALAHDMVSFKDVGRILEKMDRQGGSFSDVAIEIGILSRKQVKEIKKRYPEQRIYIGQLLVATGKLTRGELELELEQFEKERMLVASPNVTKARLIGMIAESTGIERETVKKVVGGLISTLSQALAAGETVELRSFGKFKSRRYAARTARNPRTGKSISIPARRVPRLQYARKLRRYVESGTSSKTKR